MVTLALAALFGTLTLLFSVERLTYFISDDAFYYLNVARNIVSGAGSTFDGMDPSNGYHPLWMVCLLPVYWLFGHSAEAGLRAAMLVQVLLVCATLWLAWDIYRRYRANTLAVIVAITLALTLFSPVQMMFNGLETDLVVVLTVLLVQQDSKRSFLDADATRAWRAVLGLLLGLLVLARLDQAFLLVGMAICALLRTPGTVLRRTMSLCRAHWLTVVVFATMVTPYFLWNVAEFGHPTPISGALKTTFPHPTFRPEVLTLFAPYVAGTLLAGLALIPLWRPNAATLSRSNLELLTGLWVGCCIEVGWAVFFTSWGTFQWHFAAHVPIICLILSLCAARILPNPRSAVTVLVGGMAAIAVSAFNWLAYYEKGDYHRGSYAAALWARANTPPDSVFALKDAGVFGYFSERPTINLDGLINSYEYYGSVREGHVMEFLRNHNVKWLADAYASCGYPDEHHVWIRYPQLPVDYGLTVTRAEEIFRSDESAFRPLTMRMHTCFIVWSFDKATLEVRKRSAALGLD